jgi:hypothetical protein
LETQDSRWVTVESVKRLDGLAVVYNFTVEDDHDYFVGDEGLLVHNAGVDAKPPYSPDPTNWVNKGGSYTTNADGSWTYTDWESNSVTYTNGYPDFSPYARQQVQFPNGYTGNRALDSTLADQMAPLGQKLADSQWHHVEDLKTMQEIPGVIHQRFNHQGGVSLKCK